MAHASDLLGNGEHYLSIEIWDGDRRVGKVGRQGD